MENKEKQGLDVLGQTPLNPLTPWQANGYWFIMYENSVATKHSS